MEIDLKKLSPHLFWDTDINQLNADIHASYIITRVVERGSCDDVKYIWGIYGADKVREVLQHARCLSNKTISFFSNVFGEHTTDFRAGSATKSSNIWNT